MPLIYFNDQKLIIEPNQTLAQLLLQKQGSNPPDNPFAVAINQQFIPRRDYERTPLEENDVVDVIGPQQGG